MKNWNYNIDDLNALEKQYRVNHTELDLIVLKRGEYLRQAGIGVIGAMCLKNAGQLIAFKEAEKIPTPAEIEKNLSNIS